MTTKNKWHDNEAITKIFYFNYLYKIISPILLNPVTVIVWEQVYILDLFSFFFFFILFILLYLRIFSTSIEAKHFTGLLFYFSFFFFILFFFFLFFFIRFLVSFSIIFGVCNAVNNTPDLANKTIYIFLTIQFVVVDAVVAIIFHFFLLFFFFLLLFFTFSSIASWVFFFFFWFFRKKQLLTPKIDSNKPQRNENYLYKIFSL